MRFLKYLILTSFFIFSISKADEETHNMGIRLPPGFFEEIERKRKEEAERKAREEAAKKAKAKADAERKAREEAARRAQTQAEAERRAREEAERRRIERIEQIRIAATSEESDLRLIQNSGIIHKISFETIIKSIESAACTISSNVNNPFIDIQTSLSIFQAAFGHTDWQSYSQNCDSVPVNITSFDQCPDGAAEVHCQNRAAYFAVKASLDAKRILLESWQTELVSLGDDSVRESIEGIKNATIIN